MPSVVLIAESLDEAALQQLSSAIENCTPVGNVKLGMSEGFTGVRALTAIFASGAAAVVSVLSNVVSAWVHQHRHCKVKVNGIEISGYSAQDTTKLLKKIFDEKRSSN